MTLGHVKLVMLFWGLLAIADIKIDRWYATILFGLVSCTLGAVVSVAGPNNDSPERKEVKNFGLLLLCSGIAMSLMEMIRWFVVSSYR